RRCGRSPPTCTRSIGTGAPTAVTRCGRQRSPCLNLRRTSFVDTLHRHIRPSMNHPLRPTTRREFLRSSAGGMGLLAFARFAPAFLVQSTLAGAPKPERDRSVLVLVQLAGGNDGLNTVVPYADDRYHRLRPSLALKRDAVLPLSDNAGLHPACTALRDLFNEGRLGIVQNVGYPNPNRSHFRSTEIWETASGSDEILGTGWVG